MIFMTIFLSLLLLTIFFFVSSSEKWDNLQSSIFECGFTSYFFSRFSFSIHYFMIGLIFLFLDLELCFIMPFFLENMNSSSLHNKINTIMLILLLGLMIEWVDGKLDWKF